MTDDFEELKRYLGRCIESWVEHDLLRMHFSEEVIWAGVTNDLLKMTRTFHRYNIRVPHSFSV